MTYVVIGANYGDEGKGLITDFLVREQRATIVCRFNGGAQAGHTVTLPDGGRHVFGHVGAGHFAGAATYLSKRFIVNPLLLEREVSKLLEVPMVFAHPSAQVTTIYDMLINAAIEQVRGNDRHGSCGLGINETVTRAAAGFGLTFKLVKSACATMLATHLRNIAENWVPTRLKQLGLEGIANQITTNLGSVLDTKNYIAHAKAMMPGLALLCMTGEHPTIYARGTPNMVFEGAQGLAIDELLGNFPHVTRSLTGLPYAIEAAANLRIPELTPMYVTRGYATRHGAGPLPFAGEIFSEVDVEDTTNVDNEWQGSLRFAPLDLKGLYERIQADLKRSEMLSIMHNVRINTPELAVTCMDQFSKNVRYVGLDGRVCSASRTDFIKTVQMSTGVKVTLISTGPTAQNVVRQP